jgi:hypothetical protein
VGHLLTVRAFRENHEHLWETKAKTGGAFSGYALHSGTVSEPCNQVRLVAADFEPLGAAQLFERRHGELRQLIVGDGRSVKPAGKARRRCQ